MKPYEFVTWDAAFKCAFKLAQDSGKKVIIKKRGYTGFWRVYPTAISTNTYFDV